jgi:hypothetical protein
MVVVDVHPGRGCRHRLLGRWPSDDGGSDDGHGNVLLSLPVGIVVLLRLLRGLLGGREGRDGGGGRLHDKLVAEHDALVSGHAVRLNQTVPRVLFSSSSSSSVRHGRGGRVPAEDERPKVGHDPTQRRGHIADGTPSPFITTA